jgi:ketosteroid isomerase-like protein
MLITLPRKNGKSRLIGTFAAWHLLTTPQAQVIVVANSKEQAEIIDRYARHAAGIRGLHLQGAAVRPAQLSEAGLEVLLHRVDRNRPSSSVADARSVAGSSRTAALVCTSAGALRLVLRRLCATTSRESGSERDTARAMSLENAKVVRAVVEAQQRRDWQAFRRLYDPEIEWEDVSGLWGDWGTRRGFEQVRDAWVTWFEAFERVDFEIEDLVEAGDKVVARIRVSGRGRESGLVIDQRLPSVWTVRSARVVRVRAYRDDADALEAAGLRK